MQSEPSVHFLQTNASERVVPRRPTFAEGLYSGLVTSPFAASPGQDKGGPSAMEGKLRLLVEAPAAVEDALASLLNHIDSQVQASVHTFRAFIHSHMW